MTIHVARDNQQLGTFSLEEINQGLAIGRFQLTDLAWHEGLAEWQKLQTIAGVSSSAAVPPPPTLPPAASIQGFPLAQPARGSAPSEKIPNYLPHSIIATLLCCLPFGIVGIVYATQVDNKVARGDFDGARHASKLARNWTIASAASSALVLVIYLAGMAISGWR